MATVRFPKDGSSFISTVDWDISSHMGFRLVPKSVTLKWPWTM